MELLPYIAHHYNYINMDTGQNRDHKIDTVWNWHCATKVYNIKYGFRRPLPIKTLYDEIMIDYQNINT